MADAPDDTQQEDSLSEVLRRLPLLDELFLGMQAMNIDLVDDFLEEQEAQLLREYVEMERTPIPAALLVSALSQMWVFAVYELLRTWRQRVQEILKWAKTLQALDDDERQATVARKRLEIERRASEARDVDLRWQVFEQAHDARFVDELRSAVHRTELVFHAVEAVRVTLAKHEVSRREGVYAAAPGYARIDMSDGSMQWHLELGRNEIEIVSRRGLADALRALAKQNDRILPGPVQEKVATLERDGYGLNKVVAILGDGTEVPGVRVLWATEVVAMDTHERIPFDVENVVDVRADPTPEHDPDDAAPF
jgi:hypothetical protein